MVLLGMNLVFSSSCCEFIVLSSSKHVLNVKMIYAYVYKSDVVSINNKLRVST